MSSSLFEIKYSISKITNLCNFNLTGLKNIENIFDGCENLNDIDMGKLEINQDVNFEGSFNGVPDEGCIVCNKSFVKEGGGMVPGGWEKVLYNIRD